MIRLASVAPCAHKRGGIWFFRLGRFGLAFWYTKRHSRPLPGAKQFQPKQVVPITAGTSRGVSLLVAGMQRKR